MKQKEVKTFIVRVYNLNEQMTHTFRVAAENQTEAENKVEAHIQIPKAIVIARPSLTHVFWE